MSDLMRIMHSSHDGSESGGYFGEADGFDRVLGIQLNRPESITYSLGLDDEMARREFLEPDVTDFIVYYKDHPIAGGMHSEVDIDNVDDGIVKVAGVGWLDYFDHRIWPPTKDGGLDNDPYQATDKYTVVIAEELFDAVSTNDNPRPFFLKHAIYNTAALQPTDFLIEIGDTESILSKVQGLSKMDPGFDLEITWDKWANFYVPRKTNVLDYVFEQGVNCESLTYRNPGFGGNFYYGTGSISGGRIASIQRNADSITQKRRRDITEEFGELISQEVLDFKVAGAAGRQLQPLRQISLTWTGDPNIANIFFTLGIGDTVKVRGDINYDTIDEYLRIVGMEVQPTNEDDERIVFTFDDGTLSL